MQEENDMTTIAGRLRWARQRRALSQEQLAAKSGVTEAAISRIENGKILAPRMGTMQKLAKAITVDPGWLVTGDDTLRPTG